MKSNKAPPLNICFGAAAKILTNPSIAVLKLKSSSMLISITKKKIFVFDFGIFDQNNYIILPIIHSYSFF